MSDKNQLKPSSLSFIPIFFTFLTWGFIVNLFNVFTAFLQKTFQLSNTEISVGIPGGFFIPLLFGRIADNFSLRISLIVVIPLLFTATYGFYFNQLLATSPKHN